MTRLEDQSVDADADESMIEYLKGWVAAQYAADQLVVSRQAVHKMIREGRIPAEHVRRIKNYRPVFIIRESYLTRLVAQREATAPVVAASRQQKAAEKAARALRQEVRSWARAQGIVVSNRQPVPQDLFDRYLKEQARAPRKATKNPQS